MVEIRFLPSGRNGKADASFTGVFYAPCSVIPTIGGIFFKAVSTCVFERRFLPLGRNDKAVSHSELVEEFIGHASFTTIKLVSLLFIQK
ncbi:hypothetical protein [uncultured Mucilaginibacter sp.]|uniref:hypothetical protein n=1 Tax=uncultured Mucilaginibacter sp. TaxID=797541 RepID=UPI002601AE52|nr:hypothetical protein [uncultured Mucilaginibacter sp.]